MSVNIFSMTVPHRYRNRFLRDGGSNISIIGGGSTSSSSSSSGLTFEPHYLWGQYFDDTQDISGDLTGVGSIAASGVINASGITLSDFVNAPNISGTNAVFDTGIFYSSITSNSATINNVTGETATFEEIDSETATINNISSTNGNITNLSGVSANFQGTVRASNFIGNNATISNTLKASTISGNNAYISNKIETKKIEALSGFIKTLLSEEITVDNLTVTKAAHFFKLIIDEIKATQGQIIITPSNMVADKVTVLTNGNYRVYSRSESEGKRITNTFVTNDQVVCQTFNAASGVTYNASNKYYWALVTNVGQAQFITFEDEQTKNLFISNFNVDGDNDVSVSELQNVTALTTSQGWETLSGTCNELRYLTSLTTIPKQTFYNGNVTEITLPNSVTSIGTDAFRNCKNLIEVNLNEGLRTLGNYSFRYCQWLPSITIPSTVTNIGTGAFSVCNQLTDVYCLATTPPTLNSGNFTDYCPNLANIYVPSGAVNSYKSSWSTLASYIKPIETEIVSREFDNTTEDYNYIDISSTDKDSYSNGVPEVGDNIVQLGNRTDNTRQAAIIISAYNQQFLDPTIKAPSIVQYYGINDYNLQNHRRNVISRDFNEFKGSFKTSTGEDIEDLIDDIPSGATPYIVNGYWWINGESTGVKAEGTDGRDGQDGASGYTPYIYNNYWYINGYNTGVKAAGEDGLNGSDGVDGADGTSSYFHVAYCNKTTAGTITDFSTSNPNNRDYIGTYVDSTVADSTNPNSYAWQLVKGAQGEKGDQGISGTSGQDGRTSYLHIKYSNDGGRSFTSNSGETVGKYLGQYVDFNSADSMSVNSYTWALIKGEDGNDGNDGNDGVSITGVTEYYLISSANTNVTTATTGWQTSFIAPTPEKKYLWNYEQSHFSNGISTKTTPIIIGNYAKDGTNGTNGTDGRGISSIVEYYLVSTAKTGITTSTTGWSTSIPTMSPYFKYLWNYEEVNYTDIGYLTDPKIIGVYGDTGQDGRDGTDGRDAVATIVNPSAIIVNCDSNGTPLTDTYHFTVRIELGGVTVPYYGSMLIEKPNSWTSFIGPTADNNGLDVGIIIPTTSGFSNSNVTVRYTGNYHGTVISVNATARFIGVKNGANGQNGQKGDKGDKGDTGANAEQWILDPVYEKAQIDSSGNLDLKFCYSVYHISGNTVEDVRLNTSGGYYIVIEPDTLSVPSGVEYQHKLGDTTWAKSNYITDYYNVPTSKRPNGFYAYLVSGNNDNYIEGVAQRYVPVVYSAMASLEVKNEVDEQGNTIASITTRVTNSESTISGHTNQLSQLQQTASGLTTSVENIYSQIDLMQGSLDTQTTQISTLQQTASSLTSTVSSHTQSINSNSSNITQLQQTSSAISSTVTSISEGDTRNLFYPSCYSSDGMSNAKNQWLLTDILDGTVRCSSWASSSMKNGKPIVNGWVSAEINTTGEIYLYSPYITLNKNYKYSLTFEGQVYNYCYLEICRYTSQARALSATSNITSVQSLTTLGVSTNQYTYNQSIFTFTPSTTSSYNRIRFRLTNTNSNTPVFDLKKISLYQGTTSAGISTGGFAPWIDTVSKLTSQITQRSEEINIGLNRAGINLTSGKITSIADNFEWINNEGETVLGLDSNGDANFNGTVRAKNLYKTLALASNDTYTLVLTPEGTTTVWIYVNTTFTCEENGKTYTAGHYYEIPPTELSELYYYPSDAGYYKVITGPADEVIVVSGPYPNGSYYVVLPKSSDYVGKAVTIRHTIVSGKTVTVTQCDGSYNAFSHDGISIYDENNDHTPDIIYGSHMDDDFSISYGQTVTFYSVGLYWIRLHVSE